MQINEFEPLDFTRIHPDNYPLSKKIAKDSLDEEIPNPDRDDSIIKIM